MDTSLEMAPIYLRRPQVAADQSVMGAQTFNRKWMQVATGSINSRMNGPQFNLITGSGLVSSCFQQSSEATQTSGQGSGSTNNVAAARPRGRAGNESGSKIDAASEGEED